MGKPRLPKKLVTARRFFSSLAIPIFIVAVGLVLFAWRNDEERSMIDPSLMGCYQSQNAGLLVVDSSNVALSDGAATKVSAGRGNDKSGEYILTQPGIIYIRNQSGELSWKLAETPQKSYRIDRSTRILVLRAELESGEVIEFERSTCLE